ncbi:MAG: NUDIX domain-containing protein [Saprospiraceae bacterium]
MDFFAKLFKWPKAKQKTVIIPRITARVIIEQDDQYLFLLQTDERGGRLSLPGGGIKYKESVRKGLVREVKEETNLIVSKKALIPVHTHYRKKKQALEIIFFFKITINDFSDLALNEPEKFTHFVWHSKENIPKNLIPECKIALKKINKGIIFSEKRKKKKKSKNKIIPNTTTTNVLPTLTELPLIKQPLPVRL